MNKNLPGFVGGTSTIVMLSLACFFLMASVRDSFSSIVFIGSGVSFLISSIALSNFLLVIASSSVLYISST